MEKRVTFSCFDKEILKELVVLRPSILKNKTRSNSVTEENNATWREIVNDFNSVSGVTKRNEKQLKKLWQNLKQDRKDVFKVARQASHTGGGQHNPQGNSQDPVDSVFDSLIVLPIPGAIDSDSIGTGTLMIETNTAADDYDDDNIAEPISLPVRTCTEDTLSSNMKDNILMEDINEGASASVISGKSMLNHEPTKSTAMIRNTPNKRGPSRSKPKLIMEEVQARQNRVRSQEKNDDELHQYLLQKVKAEAELATFQLDSAKKIAEEEAKRERLLFENEVQYLAEKRKLELKILYK